MAAVWGGREQDVTALGAQIVAEIGAAVARTDSTECVELLDAILAARRVFVCGAGRSGLMAQAFAMRLVHLGLAAHVVGEVTTPAIEAGDLLIAATGSGETRTTLAMVQAAKERGARTVTVTAHPDTSVGRASDLVVQLHGPVTGPRGPDSVQPAGSLFEQSLLVFFDACVLALMKRLGTTEQDMRARHTKLE